MWGELQIRNRPPQHPVPISFISEFMKGRLFWLRATGAWAGARETASASARRASAAVRFARARGLAREVGRGALRGGVSRWVGGWLNRTDEEIRVDGRGLGRTDRETRMDGRVERRGGVGWKK